MSFDFSTKLKAGINRDTDLHTDDDNILLSTVGSPYDMTDEQLIDALIYHHKQYKNTLEYEALTDGDFYSCDSGKCYNSNSYIYGLLEAAGVPPMKSFSCDKASGPVPAGQFGPTYEVTSKTRAAGGVPLDLNISMSGSSAKLTMTKSDGTALGSGTAGFVYRTPGGEFKPIHSTTIKEPTGSVSYSFNFTEFSDQIYDDIEIFAGYRSADGTMGAVGRVKISKYHHSGTPR
ncbi:MAG: hypothetical protein D3913_16655 [Candidatus Electrothrix sp. LOE1_4_5]|nr:hypothetical protein [Candidatus Electrothrix gigas]